MVKPRSNHIDYCIYKHTYCSTSCAQVSSISSVASTTTVLNNGGGAVRNTALYNLQQQSQEVRSRNYICNLSEYMYVRTVCI